MERFTGSKRKSSANADEKRARKRIGIGAIHLSTKTTMHTKDKEIVDTLVRNPHIVKKFRGRLNEIPQESCISAITRDPMMMNDFNGSTPNDIARSRKLVTLVNKSKVEWNDISRRMNLTNEEDEGFHEYLLSSARDSSVSWIDFVGGTGVGIRLSVNQGGNMIENVWLNGQVDDVILEVEGKVTLAQVFKGYLSGVPVPRKLIIEKIIDEHEAVCITQFGDRWELAPKEEKNHMLRNFLSDSKLDTWGVQHDVVRTGNRKIYYVNI